MILRREVINYFWLPEVIFQLFVSKCKLHSNVFENIYSCTLIGIWVAYSGFWLESWLTTFHGQAEGHWVKEK